MRSKKNADSEALVGRIQATSDALQQDALVGINRNAATLIASGPDFDHDSGVLYRNVEGYLKGLV